MAYRSHLRLLVAAIFLFSTLLPPLFAQTPDPLPDYVVEQFGEAPPIPQGPHLSLIHI